MRLVVIESPFAGNVERNRRYLRACLADCLRRGEAPFASHALYTQPGVLDDINPVERDIGIAAGFAWREMAEATVIYTDLGMSRGMIAGLHDADRVRLLAPGRGGEHRIEYRHLGGEWSAE